ncbi:MAG: glycosyltransferase [Candidatus Bathyarchaeota archaeon]|nr:glycosyltransferase [Candidatus Bathyarchaeota archaeon]
MIWLLAIWVTVGALFLGVPAGYFFYMRRSSSSGWNLKLDRDYVPSTTILIPVHNEEKIIRYKLENISKVNYPKDKMDIIIVNDSSTDNTLTEVNHYIQDYPNQKIKIFDSKVHMGKTGCLNNALKTINSDIVIISDVDCFWPSDILTKAISYLSDPTVGAITARELLLNPKDSWVTLGEQFYDSNIQSVRIGESKLHSTIFFQGGFAAYKRSALEEFNHATDDSGTALDIVQANQRALLIPEIGFFTLSPTKWKHKVAIKLRRASHLQHLWARCLNLLIHGKLAMPKRIAVPEIVLHIFNPVLLVLLAVLSVAVMVVYPWLAAVLMVLLFGVFAVKKTRVTAFELLQNNLILFASLFSFFGNRQIKLWKPVQESRSVLTEKLLRENQLI